MARNTDNENLGLPSDWQAFFAQAIGVWLDGMRPAALYKEGVELFTTQEVIEALEPILAGITTKEVYDYLIGEGFKPTRVGEGMFWLGVRID